MLRDVVKGQLFFKIHVERRCYHQSFDVELRAFVMDGCSKAYFKAHGTLGRSATHQNEESLASMQQLDVGLRAY